MKKVIISSLIGGVIVFLFQFMSWSFLGIHKTATKSVANETEVMNVLNANLKESAVYDMPAYNMEASHEDMEKEMAARNGKPAARVIYHAAYSTSMGKPMTQGFLLDLLGMLFVAILISKNIGSFGSRFTTALYMSLYSLCLGAMMDWNWWQTPMSYISGTIIDTIIIGVLSGVWMGWYWGRGAKA